MTATGRTAVVLVILVVAGALACATIIADHANTTGAVAGFTGIAGTVLGYAFGDRNGEKRLASAIVQNAAEVGTDALAHATAVAAPSHNAHEARRFDGDEPRGSATP